MRILAILAALAIAGCAHQEATQTKTITKTAQGPPRVEKVYVDRPIKEIVYVDKEKVVYIDKCPHPIPLTAYCGSKTTQDSCDAEQRCHWVRRELKPHCRRLHCKPPYAD